MKYYKTYNFTAVFFLVVFSSFVGVLFFWSEPRPADAVQMPQQAIAKQTLNNDNGLSGANLFEVDGISDGVYSIDDDRESLFTRNSLSQLSPIEISADNSGNLPDLASRMDLDTKSGTRIIQSGSADAVASAVAADASGTASAAPAAAGNAGSSGTSNGPSGGGDSISPVVRQDKYPVFVLPSYQKVLQDEWTITGDSSAEIFCAKNETESFQILVINQSSDTLSDIEIIKSGWQPAVASSSKNPIVTLYREHYVKVEKPSYSLKSKLGMYPDALIPFVNPYTNKPIYTAKYLANHASVEPQKTQGYWVDVTVGPDVPAGIYKCSLLITSADTPIAEIPVTLQVWDFTLPARPVWTAWFCDVRREINLAYGLPQEGSAYEEILLRHQDFFYEHGIYPSFHRSPLINDDTGDVVFTDDFISDLRFFINKYGARMLYLPGVFADQPKKLKKFVMAYNAFSQANPWAGQFFYYLDEPGSPEGYNRVKQCGQIIEAFAPSIKLLVTVEDISSASLISVDNFIDIKVPLFKEATAAKIQNYCRDGQTLWTYTALTQGGPCWQLDGSLIDYRIPAWSSYSLGIEGILYWQTTVWASLKNDRPSFDPWLTQESYVSKNGQMWNGEGSLLYPGTQAGIKGPVASMRLKVFRDSVEDYAYFKLLESRAGKAQAISQVSAIAADFANYNNNPESYIAQRKAIAELILN